MNLPQSTIEDASAQVSTGTAALEAFWRRRGPLALNIASVVLAIAAGVWLSYEFWRLLFQRGEWGAIDLAARYREVQGWFAGIGVYWEYSSAVYPPATYAMLWPLLGWVPGLGMVRWLWGALAVVVAVHDEARERRHHDR